MGFLNHYSMVWIGTIIVGIAAYFMYRRGFVPYDGLKLTGIAAAFLLIWLFIRPKAGSTASESQLESQLSQQKVVLLTLQSRY